MPFSALLDACALYPQSLRDVLLRFAERDIYRLLWSADVLDEMERNLVKSAGLTAPKAARLRAIMEDAFPDNRSYRSATSFVPCAGTLPSSWRSSSQA